MEYTEWIHYSTIEKVWDWVIKKKTIHENETNIIEIVTLTIYQTPNGSGWVKAWECLRGKKQRENTFFN